jgi:hypothetical protein
VVVGFVGCFLKSAVVSDSTSALQTGLEQSRSQ